jgi:hypothetical protein
MGIPLVNNWEYFDDNVWVIGPGESHEWWFWMPELGNPQAAFLVAFPDDEVAKIQYGPFATEGFLDENGVGQTRYLVTVTNPTEGPVQFQLILMTLGIPYSNF